MLATVVAVRTWLGERSLAQGVSAQRRGDFVAAEAAFRAASGRGNADAAIERARLELLRRDWRGAGESLREAMALAPSRGFPHILQATLEIERPGPWNDARVDGIIGACRTAVALEPARSAIRSDAAGVLLNLATLRRASWEPARVRTVLAEAAAGYAEALVRNPGAAREYFTRMLDAGAPPVLLLEVASRREDTPSLSTLVGLLLDRGLWAAAGPVLWAESAERGILPAFAAATSEVLARRALIREALAAAQRGLLAAPGEKELTVRAADVAARLPGQEALAAVPLYRAAVDAEPDNAALRRRFAGFLAARELFAEAERETRAVLEAQRQDAEAWFLLGEILRRSGSAPEAASAYREAADLRPGNAVYRRAAGDVRR